MANKKKETEELLDLVDKHDRVIGEVARSEANSNPDVIHREIGVLIYDNKNRILVQQRSYKKKTDPGSWIISCAGHVSKGMTPLEAARMELREELGFDTELKFVGKVLLKYPNETHFAYLYYGKYNGEEITIDPSETVKTKFVTQNDLRTIKENVEPISYGMMMEFWDGCFRRTNT